MTDRYYVVGLGSMGKRRIRNLIANGISKDQIVGFDPREDRREEARQKYAVTTQGRFEHGLSPLPRAMIISTPPDTHINYLKICFDNGIPAFCEASVVPEHGQEVFEIVSNKPDSIYFPSFTMRYFDGPNRVRHHLPEIGEILFFTYHSGQYLPDWHPWENIQDYYVSNPVTGGCREIVPFELSWITWVLGRVSKAQGILTRSGQFSSPIDDLYRCLLDFDNGAKGVLTVDVLSRQAVRHFHAVGSQGNLQWNEASKLITIDKPNEQTRTISVQKSDSENGYISPEYPYIAEMRDFLSWLHGDKVFQSLELAREDLHCLQVLRTIEGGNSPVEPNLALPSPMTV